MSVVSTVITVITSALIVYYLLHGVLFGGLVVRAAITIARELAWPDTIAHDVTFANPLTPTVSVLVPAHNEGAGILQAVEALLELRYPHVEIIVVDDGSTDRTAAIVIDEFDLVETEVPVLVQTVPQDGATLATYRSRTHPSLILLRKDSVGRRSDAINAALRVSTSELVLMIDGDSILEPDALLHVVQPFVDDAEVVAAGGVVLPSNGARVHRGRIVSTAVPRGWIERTQVLEYLRAFLVGRSGWSSLNGLMIISGAFGLFRRDIVVEMGGLDPTSLAEDADLVLGIHRMLRDRDQPFRVVFVPEPVCWSETPSTVRVLGRQRNRWSQGLGELLWKYRRMMFRPRYGVLGCVTMPYFLAFELFGPAAELVGLSSAVVGIVLGILPARLFLTYLGVSILLSVLVSLAALLVEEVSFARYPRARDVEALFTAAFMEPLWYHLLHSWWRVTGLVRAIRRRESGWGEMTRAGFGQEP